MKNKKPAKLLSLLIASTTVALASTIIPVSLNNKTYTKNVTNDVSINNQSYDWNKPQPYFSPKFNYCQISYSDPYVFKEPAAQLNWSGLQSLLQDEFRKQKIVVKPSEIRKVITEKVKQIIYEDVKNNAWRGNCRAMIFSSWNSPYKVGPNNFYSVYLNFTSVDDWLYVDVTNYDPINKKLEMDIKLKWVPNQNVDYRGHHTFWFDEYNGIKQMNNYQNKVWKSKFVVTNIQIEEPKPVSTIVGIQNSVIAQKCFYNDWNNPIYFDKNWNEWREPYNAATFSTYQNLLKEIIFNYERTANNEKKIFQNLDLGSFSRNDLLIKDFYYNPLNNEMTILMTLKDTKQNKEYPGLIKLYSTREENDNSEFSTTVYHNLFLPMNQTTVKSDDNITLNFSNGFAGNNSWPSVQGVQPGGKLSSSNSIVGMTPFNYPIVSWFASHSNRDASMLFFSNVPGKGITPIYKPSFANNSKFYISNKSLRDVVGSKYDNQLDLFMKVLPVSNMNNEQNEFVIFPAGPTGTFNNDYVYLYRPVSWLDQNTAVELTDADSYAWQLTNSDDQFIKINLGSFLAQSITNKANICQLGMRRIDVNNQAYYHLVIGKINPGHGSDSYAVEYDSFLLNEKNGNLEIVGTPKIIYGSNNTGGPNEINYKDDLINYNFSLKQNNKLPLTPILDQGKTQFLYNDAIPIQIPISYNTNPTVNPLSLDFDCLIHNFDFESLPANSNEKQLISNVYKISGNIKDNVTTKNCELIFHDKPSGMFYWELELSDNDPNKLVVDTPFFNNSISYDQSEISINLTPDPTGLGINDNKIPSYISYYAIIGHDAISYNKKNRYSSYFPSLTDIEQVFFDSNVAFNCSVSFDPYPDIQAGMNTKKMPNLKMPNYQNSKINDKYFRFSGMYKGGTNQFVKLLESCNNNNAQFIKQANWDLINSFSIVGKPSKAFSTFNLFNRATVNKTQKTAAFESDISFSSLDFANLILASESDYGFKEGDCLSYFLAGWLSTNYFDRNFKYLNNENKKTLIECSADSSYNRDQIISIQKPQLRADYKKWKTPAEFDKIALAIQGLNKLSQADLNNYFIIKDTIMPVPGSFFASDINLKNKTFKLNYRINYFYGSSIDNNHPEIRQIVKDKLDSVLINLSNSSVPPLTKIDASKNPSLAALYPSNALYQYMSSPSKNPLLDFIYSEFKSYYSQFNVNLQNSDIIIGNDWEVKNSLGQISVSISIPKLAYEYKYGPQFMSQKLIIENFQYQNETGFAQILSPINAGIRQTIEPSGLQNFLNAKWYNIYYLLQLQNPFGNKQLINRYLPYKYDNVMRDYTTNPDFNPNGLDRNNVFSQSSLLYAQVKSYDDTNGIATADIYITNGYSDVIQQSDGAPKPNSPYSTMVVKDFKFIGLGKQSFKTRVISNPILPQTTLSVIKGFYPYQLTPDNIKELIIRYCLVDPATNPTINDINIKSYFYYNYSGRIHVRFTLRRAKDSNGNDVTFNSSTNKNEYLYDVLLEGFKKVNGISRVEINTDPTNGGVELNGYTFIDKLRTYFDLNNGSWIIKDQNNPQRLSTDSLTFVNRLLKHYNFPTNSWETMNGRIVNIDPSKSTATISLVCSQYFGNMVSYPESYPNGDANGIWKWNNEKNDWDRDYVYPVYNEFGITINVGLDNTNQKIIVKQLNVFNHDYDMGYDSLKPKPAAMNDDYTCVFYQENNQLQNENAIIVNEINNHENTLSLLAILAITSSIVIAASIFVILAVYRIRKSK